MHVNSQRLSRTATSRCRDTLAVVTGANSGIGKEIAANLAAAR